MSSTEPIVYVVDDDFSVREALLVLLSAAGLRCESFASASEYLDFQGPDAPGCLVLDIGLADMSGLELQERIANECHPPVVFITGRGDVPSSVRAMKAGAVDFLTKPFLRGDLLQAVNAAIAQDRKARAERAELSVLQERLASLTAREREVLPLVVSGLLNKQAAARLGISEVTFQIHRGNVMRKMKVASLAELVRAAVSLKITVERIER
jgi:FixJ family two-component response regulator